MKQWIQKWNFLAMIQRPQSSFDTLNHFIYKKKSRSVYIHLDASQLMPFPLILFSFFYSFLFTTQATTSDCEQSEKQPYPTSELHELRTSSELIESSPWSELINNRQDITYTPCFFCWNFLFLAVAIAVEKKEEFELNAWKKKKAVVYVYRIAPTATRANDFE